MEKSNIDNFNYNGITFKSLEIIKWKQEIFQYLNLIKFDKCRQKKLGFYYLFMNNTCDFLLDSIFFFFFTKIHKDCIKNRNVKKYIFYFFKLF